MSGHLPGREQPGEEEEGPDHHKRARSEYHRQHEFLHRRQGRLAHLVVGPATNRCIARYRVAANDPGDEQDVEQQDKAGCSPEGVRLGPIP